MLSVNLSYVFTNYFNDGNSITNKVNASNYFKVRKKGLQEAYTHDEQFKGILNKMFALVYVPVEHLTAVWESVLLQDINLWNEEASSVEKEAMSNFSTYFLETYLGNNTLKVT